MSPDININCDAGIASLTKLLTTNVNLTLCSQKSIGRTQSELNFKEEFPFKDIPKRQLSIYNDRQTIISISFNVSGYFKLNLNPHFITIQFHAM